MVYDGLRLIIRERTQPITGRFEARIQTTLNGLTEQNNPGVPFNLLIDGAVYSIPAVSNQNGWMNHFVPAADVGAPGTNHTIQAFVDGNMAIKSLAIPVSISGTVPPPPPPPPPPDPIPDPPPPPPPPPPDPTPVPGGIIDKITALFPEALRPYAIPISLTAGAFLLKKVL